jgi:chemotaxis protein histidine kinase CheA
MVMPVGEIIARLKLFAGVGIMESGELSLLLDVNQLLLTLPSSKDGG